MREDKPDITLSEDENVMQLIKIRKVPGPDDVLAELIKNTENKMQSTSYAYLLEFEGHNDGQMSGKS